MKPHLTLHRPASAPGYPSELVWREDSFHSLLTGAVTAWPYVVALQIACEVTWAELKRLMEGVAPVLCEYARVGRDRAMMGLSNRVEGRLKGGHNTYPPRWHSYVRIHTDSQRAWHALC